MRGPLQAPESEWREQWTMFQDDEQFLFAEWILPATLEDLRGRDNVELVRADIAAMDLGRRFDVVVCIGVIHHTDDPDRTFANLFRHLRPGGRLIVWTYSSEGNALVRWLVEPARKQFLRPLPRRVVAGIAWLLTALLYPVVHTVYRLPLLSFLPYYEYFANFRKLSFRRNQLNVFDKLNAPQTHFTTRDTCERWMSRERFEPGSISIRRQAGVGYTLTGIKRRDL